MRLIIISILAISAIWLLRIAYVGIRENERNDKERFTEDTDLIDARLKTRLSYWKGKLG